VELMMILMMLTPAHLRFIELNDVKELGEAATEAALYVHSPSQH